MKRNNLILLVIFLFIISCNKDDDFSIIGEWRPQNSIYSVYSNGQLTYMDQIIPPAMTIKSDHTGTYTNINGFYSEFKWTLKKDTLTIINENNSATIWAVLEKHDNYLKLKNSYVVNMEPTIYETVTEYKK